MQLADLRSFLNNPVKAFLQKRLRMRLTTDEVAPADDLATKLNALEEWGVADRLIQARLEGRSTSDWEKHERALGTLPPGGLGQDLVSKVSSVVDDLIRCAVELGVGPSRGEQRAVDLALPDGTRLVGTVPIRLALPSPGPASVTYSRSAPKQRVAAWIDLVALVASEPVTRWRSVTIRRGGNASPASVMQLVVSGDSQAERHENALRALSVAVDCYRRGMREPIPLFNSLSFRLHREEATASDWRSYEGFGDGDDDAHRIAFGDIDFDQLMAIPATREDPPGYGRSRAERYAHYLWGAVEDTSEKS